MDIFGAKEFINQGLLGVLVIILFISIGYLFRYIQSLNEKRVEEKNLAIEKNLTILNEIKNNGNLIVSLLQTLLNEKK